MAFQVLQSYHRHPYLSTPLCSGTLTVSFFTHLGVVVLCSASPQTLDQGHTKCPLPTEYSLVPYRTKTLFRNPFSLSHISGFNYHLDHQGRTRFIQVSGSPPATVSLNQEVYCSIATGSQIVSTKRTSPRMKVMLFTLVKVKVLVAQSY